MSTMSMVTTVKTLLVALALSTTVLGFEFSYSAPRACDELELSWSGGTPPFQLLITPAFGTPRNISIPDESYDGSTGNFKTVLEMRPVSHSNPDQFLLTMSDATGFGTGGTSAVLRAGDSATGNSCNNEDIPVDFQFQTPDSFQQCRPYRILEFTGATQPATIYGLIPLGTSFILSPEPGATEYTFTVNIASGTDVIFFMTDAQGRQGGATDILRVGNSDEAGCLNADSPHSTASEDPGPTQTGSSSTGESSTSSQSSTATAEPDSSSSNGAIIGGSIAGAIVALVAVVTLIIFLLKRRRARREDPYAYSGKRRGSHLRSVDLAAQPAEPFDPYRNLPAQNQYEPDPFVFPPPGATSPTRANPYARSPSDAGPGYPQSHAPSSYYGDDPYGGVAPLAHPPSDSVSVNSAPHNAHTARSASISSKAALAGTSNNYGPAPRFILHTDAGSIEEADEVVELPPTYTAVGGRKVTTPGSENTPSLTSNGQRSGTSDASSNHPLASGSNSYNRGPY